MSFAPLDSPNENAHRRQLARAANAALRGETHNTGTFTLPAGATDYVIRDPRLNAERAVLLSPLDAEAANLRPWLDKTSVVRGEATVRFTAAPASDCTFDYVIVGTQPINA